MNVNEVLELEYLIEDISSDIVSIESDPTGNLSTKYISKESCIFDPPKAETYQLEINNQIIEIDVYDIPDSVVNRVPFSEGSGTTAYATVGSSDITLNNNEQWTSESSFENGTGPVYDQTDDGPSTWEPRSTLPWSCTLRLRGGPTIENTYPKIFSFDSANNGPPFMFYRTDDEAWMLRPEGDTTDQISVSEPTSNVEGSIRIIGAAVNSSNVKLRVYEGDATTLVGQATKTASPSFASSTMEVAGVDSGNWDDAIDLIDIHNKYLTDSEFDQIVSDVYG